MPLANKRINPTALSSLVYENSSFPASNRVFVKPLVTNGGRLCLVLCVLVIVVKYKKINVTAGYCFSQQQRKIMIKNLCLFIIISLAGCVQRLPRDADLNITLFDNSRTYNLSSDQVVTMLSGNLENYLLTTSSTTPKIESIKHYVPGHSSNNGHNELDIMVTNYKPKASNLTACRGGYRRQGEGYWESGERGLDHGIMKITIISVDKKTTRVIVQTSFIEVHEETHRGRITGFSEGAGSGSISGSVGNKSMSGDISINTSSTQYSAKKVDVGSQCYSTGIIETYVLSLIKGNAAKIPEEKWGFEEMFPIVYHDKNNSRDFLQEMKNITMDSSEEERKNAGINMLENANDPFYNIGNSHQYAQDANNLGILYVTGQEVKKNELMAFKLFEKATALKKSQKGARLNPWKAVAFYNLGVMYEQGIGTNKNEPKALELFNQSADSGNLDAQRKLGYLYHYGLLGLKKDKSKATGWLVVAALIAERKGYLLPNSALRNLGYI